MFHFIWIGLLLLSSGSPISGTDNPGVQTQGNGVVKTDECLQKVESVQDILGKYQVLRNLQINDEDTFYSCLIRHVDKMLPIVYTPGVAEVCLNYGKITGDIGITLRITEKDDIVKKLEEWRQKHPNVKAIVVTDGGRILGLGDIGANGMGIPVGKMAIYSALGGVYPEYCLPVTLDVGTDKTELRTDTTGLYVGLKQERTIGEEYYDFVKQFMASAVHVFGARTLIQFEDFANPNAFKFLDEYKTEYTMFNDDIQGTAAVALAGILAAEKVSEKKLKDSIVLFAGAGEAAIGIADLIVDALVAKELSLEEARKKIYMKKSDKLIMKGDQYGENDGRRRYLQSLPEGVPENANINNLLEIIKWLKPNILIGVSSKGKLFDEDVLKEMAKHNEAPIIFALSNPTENSECTAEEAYRNTEGKVLFASGSPFPPFEWDGKTRHPQQCNNAYIFPGVALAVTATQMQPVPNEVFLIAAQTLANSCTLQEDFDQGSLFPKLERLRDCSIVIATEVAKYAFRKEISAVENVPKEEDVRKFILDHHYTPSGLKA